eukprot:TRINITY_DN12497_c0_g2_i2.p1 TRINITY_DN12497_c0_g2~~TRINITY_DN12497_c0_g2_i2.p1  ORF type:complete len:496 (-),score=139.25 TRINITY_DN12497_c0_g2_i2:38-1525(-)
MLCTKDVAGSTNQVEKWYGVEYSAEPFSDELKRRAGEPRHDVARISKKTLHLPPPNRFIPKDLSLLPAPASPQALPTKIFEDSQNEVWFKRDTTFLQPKASLRVMVYTGRVFAEFSKEFVCLSIWKELFANHMKELIYMAELANLSLEQQVKADGMELKANGFNDSLASVLEEFLTVLATFSPEERQYNTIVEKLRLDYENELKQVPYQQALVNTVVLLLSHEKLKPQDFLNALSRTTFAEFLEFSRVWLSRTRHEFLFVGNLEVEFAKQIVTTFTTHLAELQKNGPALTKEESLESRVVRIPHGRWLYEFPLALESEVNSVAMAYYQIGAATDPSRESLTHLLETYLADRAYNQLRTTEQLGYIVATRRRAWRQVLGLFILVQSNVANANQVQTRIQSFLDGARKEVASLAETEFQKYIESVAVDISQRDLSISEEADRYWKEVREHQYVFNRKDVLVKALKALTIPDFIAFFEEVLFTNRSCLLYTSPSPRDS